VTEARKNGQQQQRQKPAADLSQAVLDDSRSYIVCNPKNNTDVVHCPVLSEKTYFSDCSGEIAYSAGSDIDVVAASIMTSGIDHMRHKDQSAAGLAKAREYIHKYVKILKPSSKKLNSAADQESSREYQPGAVCKAVADTKSCNIRPEASHHKRRLPPPPRAVSSSNRSFPSFSCNCRLAQATATAPGVVTSRRRSTVMRASTRGTPVVQLCSNSVSELECAIQGAIAHCKESQAAEEPEPFCYYVDLPLAPPLV